MDAPPAREGSRRRASPWLGVATIFTLSLALLASQSSEARRGLDDAYITYQYAKNIAHGHGFVFNAGDPPTLGTSTPLYAGLLALGAWLGFDIPTLSIGIGMLAMSVALGLAVGTAWEFGLVSAGLVAGVTLSVAQLYWRWQGMETALYLALILAAIWTAYRGRSTLAFVLATLATITRLDGLAVLVAVGLLLGHDRRWSWRAIGPGAALLSSWLITALWLFGSPVPASGLAKMAHDVLRISEPPFSPLSPRLLMQALPVTQVVPPVSLALHPVRTTMATGLLVAVPLACAGLLQPRRLSATLAAWLAFYLAGYQLLGLPGFGWYYGPPALVLALFLWMALQAATRSGVRVATRDGSLAAVVVVWTIGLVTVAVWVLGPPRPPPVQPRSNSTRLAAARWLRQHAAPGDTVVAYEVGTLAFLSNLRTIDLLGLTDPAARPHLRDRDLAWAIRDLPTYVFSNEGSRWPVTRAIFKECAFALNYRPVLRLPFRVDTDYVLYRRAPPPPTPDATRASDGVEWIDAHYPTSIRHALTTAFSLTVANRSASPWRTSGMHLPFITYEWRDEAGDRAMGEPSRTPIPCDVAPGGRILVSASIRTPEKPGTYTLTWLLGGEDGAGLAEPGPPAASAPVVVY